MTKNKLIIIICSIIALSILAIDIILSIVAGLNTFSSILMVIFAISLVCLLIYADQKEEPKKQKRTPLNEIEKTIIIKLEDLQSESLTPIRNEKEIEIIDDESIKKDLNHQRENNITKEKLEEELSKTVFINNLKDKIKLFEEEQSKIKLKEEEKELKELNKLIKERKSK